jgi:hypothetical protein
MKNPTPETRGEGPEIAVVVAPTARRNGRYMARPGERHSYRGHYAEMARTKNVMALSDSGCIPFAGRGL